MLRLERRNEPLLPPAAFIARLARYAAVAAVIVLVSLGLGVAGYHYLARLPWVDALLNAAMILGGMGPVDPMATVAAKLFASAYALFSGVVFIATMGVLLAPVLHRILHHFHIENR